MTTIAPHQQPAPDTTRKGSHMSETVYAATARVYANGGWSVFPVAPGGKLPLIPTAHDKDDPLRGVCKGGCGKFGHGLHDATADLDTLAAWWARCPDASIGLPAGANGLAIIDVDPRHGGEESLAQLRDYAADNGVDLMATLTQYTGGGGLHLIYAAPEGGIKGKANAFGPDMPGLDTRGRGGYVVAAPSGHVSGGTYQWVDYGADTAPWPDFLTAIVDPPKPPPVERIDRKRTGNAVGYAQTALQGEVDGVLAASEGNRNNRLHLAAFNLGQLVGGRELDDNQVRRELLSAAHAIGLGEREALATIDSGIGAGAAKPRMGRAA